MLGRQVSLGNDRLSNPLHVVCESFAREKRAGLQLQLWPQGSGIEAGNIDVKRIDPCLFAGGDAISNDRACAGAVDLFLGVQPRH